jgi:RNA polymerase sigma factor (sigma-70 family)
MNPRASALSRIFSELVQGESESQGSTGKRSSDPFLLESEVRGIHEAYSHTLTAFAKKFAGDADTAEDALQEAYHRYLVVRTEGREIANPQAWLLRVIHNLIVDWKKAQARQSELKDDFASPRMEETSYREEYLLNLLKRARNELSPREAEILDMRLKGLRYSDVAEDLGIGIGSVSAHLTRALRKLRRARMDDRL